MNVLEKYLLDNDLTQTDFANLVKVSPSIVNLWCSGKSTPSPKNALKIYKKTGGRIPVDEFGYVLLANHKVGRLAEYFTLAKKNAKI